LRPGRRARLPRFAVRTIAAIGLVCFRADREMLGMCECARPQSLTDAIESISKGLFMV
jgi:hypothetical protein